MNIISLPPEIIFKILSFIPIPDLLTNCSLVNHKFHELISSPWFQSSLCNHKKLDHSYVLKLHIPNGNENNDNMHALIVSTQILALEDYIVYQIVHVTKSIKYTKLDIYDKLTLRLLGCETLSKAWFFIKKIQKNQFTMASVVDGYAGFEICPPDNNISRTGYIFRTCTIDEILCSPAGVPRPAATLCLAVGIEVKQMGPDIHIIRDKKKAYIKNDILGEYKLSKTLLVLTYAKIVYQYVLPVDGSIQLVVAIGETTYFPPIITDNFILRMMDHYLVVHYHTYTFTISLPYGFQYNFVDVIDGYAVFFIAEEDDYKIFKLLLPNDVKI